MRRFTPSTCPSSTSSTRGTSTSGPTREVPFVSCEIKQQTFSCFLYIISNLLRRRRGGHGFRGRRRGVEGGGRAGHESSWRRRTRHGRRVQRQGRRSEGGRGLAVVRERVYEPKSRHGRRGPGLGEEGRVREFQEQSSLSERAAQGGAGHQEDPGDAQEKRSAAVTKPARRVRPVSCQAGGRARGHSRSVALVVSCRHGRLLCCVP